ncbi:MAG: hypothetical protein E7266_00970 [Lachnospiraceae bacterium]|nr:hypothetical protein [Lachnospiraceae bacterium]
MAELFIDTGKVKEIAMSIGNIRSEIANEFNDVHTKVVSLKNSWKTDSGETDHVAQAAINVFGKINEDYFDMVNVQLETLVKYLYETVGEQYEIVEEKNKDNTSVSAPAATGGLNNTNSSTVVGGGTTGVSGATSVNSDANTRLSNVAMLRNCSARVDGADFLEYGCNITSIANLYRRKLALEGSNIDVTKNMVLNANNGSVSANWYTISSNMQTKYNTGYGMVIESGGTNTTRINELLAQNPEGVMVYSQGTSSPHSVVVTGYDAGGYRVVDPIDGVEKYWHECFSTQYNQWAVFPGWSFESFLANAARVVYIPN